MWTEGIEFEEPNRTGRRGTGRGTRRGGRTESPSAEAEQTRVGAGHHIAHEIRQRGAARLHLRRAAQHMT